jgi:hypothetical protein
MVLAHLTHQYATGEGAISSAFYLSPIVGWFQIRKYNLLTVQYALTNDLLMNISLSYANRRRCACLFLLVLWGGLVDLLSQV